MRQRQTEAFKWARAIQSSYSLRHDNKALQLCRPATLVVYERVKLQQKKNTGFHGVTRIADIISQVGLHFSLPERANRRRLKLDLVLSVRRGTADFHSQVGCFCKI